jgi:hypothetical protein
MFHIPNLNSSRTYDPWNPGASAPESPSVAPQTMTHEEEERRIAWMREQDQIGERIRAERQQSKMTLVPLQQENTCGRNRRMNCFWH